MLGNGVTKYIVPSTTRVADSCPCFIPVLKVKACTRRPALPVLISFSGLKRNACGVPDATGHSPSAASATFVKEKIKTATAQRRITDLRRSNTAKAGRLLLETGLSFLYF